jgi:hypothetical protein
MSFVISLLSLDVKVTIVEIILQQHKIKTRKRNILIYRFIVVLYFIYRFIVVLYFNILRFIVVLYFNILRFIVVLYFDISFYCCFIF